jgi:hypothetical protein
MEGMGNMKKFSMLALAALVLMAAPAYAQMADQPTQPGNMPENGAHQTEMSVVGKIATVDLSQGTLTLDNGTQFTLPQSFEFTSFPEVGQDVAVTYDVQNGKNVLRIIDVGGGNSHTGAD